MTISAQLRSIQSDLGDVDSVGGGGVFIASDIVNMWEQAYNASNKLRVILCCTGEEIRGDFTIAAYCHRVDRQFVALVTRGRSFTPDRGAGLTETIQNAAPLFDMVEVVRDKIRSMLDNSEELPVDYKGFHSVPPETGLVIDAYQINFSLVADLPNLEAVADNMVVPA